MLGQTYTFSRFGIFCELIRIETDIKNGLPFINITGSLSKEAKEARDRIRPAIINSGYKFPMKKITINLSPAELQKNGSHYDLGIAVSVLSSSGQIELDGDEIFFGELSLSGDVRWVRGILPMVIEAQKTGYKKIFIPKDNSEDVKYTDRSNIYYLSNLRELINDEYKHLNNINAESKKHNKNPSNYLEINTSEDSESLINVKGQNNLVEALILAVSGHHHAIVLGPPGSGKTMSLSKITSIMPELNSEEINEINMIHSVFSESKDNYKWIDTRPFRNPNSNISVRGLIGGGPKIVPGEVSLAHNGVLFLDEFLDFHSDSLQVLKTIIEKKEVYLSMRTGNAKYPANFLFLAATNPCFCGYFDSNVKRCSCNEQSVKSYQKVLYSPLIDRIDIQLKVDSLKYKELNTNWGEYRTVDDIRIVVEDIRRTQIERFENEYFKYNSEIPASKIRLYCSMSGDCEELLETLTDKNHLSGRAIHKIIKLSRTIADINHNDKIQDYDLMDAIQFRYMDFKDSNILDDFKNYNPILSVSDNL